MPGLGLEVSAPRSHVGTPRCTCRGPHSWLPAMLLPGLCPTTALAKRGQAGTGSAEPLAEINFLSACWCWRQQPWLCSPWQLQCPEPTGVHGQHVSGVSKLCCRGSKRFGTGSRGPSLGHFGPMALLLCPRCQHDIPVAGKLCRSQCPDGISTANRAGSRSARTGWPRDGGPGQRRSCLAPAVSHSRRCLENSQGARWGQGWTLSPSCPQVMVAEQPGRREVQGPDPALQVPGQQQVQAANSPELLPRQHVRGGSGELGSFAAPSCIYLPKCVGKE